MRIIFSSRDCSTLTALVLEPRNPKILARQIILRPDKYLLSTPPCAISLLGTLRFSKHNLLG